MEQLSRRTILASTAAIVTLAGMPTAFGQGAKENLDAMMAMKLLIAGRKQIAVCQAALTRLADEGTKEFAKAEIQEHQEMKQKLNKMGFEYQPSDGANTNNASRKSGFTANSKALSEQEALQLQIDDEVASQCIDTQKAEMSKLQGKEHDKRFIESQLDAHYDLFDHGVTFKKHASTQLGGSLEEARKVIEKHIAWCKDLCKSLA